MITVSTPPDQTPLPCAYCRSTDVAMMQHLHHGWSCFVVICNTCEAQGPMNIKYADAALRLWNEARPTTTIPMSNTEPTSQPAPQAPVLLSPAGSPLTLEHLLAQDYYHRLTARDKLCPETRTADLPALERSVRRESMRQTLQILGLHVTEDDIIRSSSPQRKPVDVEQMAQRLRSRVNELAPRPSNVPPARDWYGLAAHTRQAHMTALAEVLAAHDVPFEHDKMLPSREDEQPAPDKAAPEPPSGKVAVSMLARKLRANRFELQDTSIEPRPWADLSATIREAEIKSLTRLLANLGMTVAPDGYVECSYDEERVPSFPMPEGEIKSGAKLRLEDLEIEGELEVPDDVLLVSGVVGADPARLVRELMARGKLMLKLKVTQPDADG